MDSDSFVSKSPASSGNAVLDRHEVAWQWKKEKYAYNEWKKTWHTYNEWTSYTSQENHDIEQAFQHGLERCRIKLGDVPMQLFLYDRMQYNPITAESNEIRRLGPESIYRQAIRRTRSFLRYIMIGSVNHKRFLKDDENLRCVKSSKVKPVRVHFCKQIVDTHVFSALQILMIVLYTAFLGFDADYNGSTASGSTRSAFETIDHCFCAFFVSELVIRFGAMHKKPTFKKVRQQVLKDKWFTFDLILVVFMVIELYLLPFLLRWQDASLGLQELSSLRMLRLAKMTRTVRFAKLLRSFPELLIMVKGLFAAMRAVCCTFFLLISMLYVFALIFKIRAEETDIEGMFPTVPLSMWRLLVHGCFVDELASTVEAIGAGDPYLATLFMMFVIFSNLMMLNMLIGIVCDVANDVSQKDKESAAAKSLTADLWEFLSFFDTDEDKKVSLYEFELLLGNRDVQRMLDQRGVDVNTLLDLKQNLFSNRDGSEKCLKFDDLVDVMNRLRAKQGGPATLLDIHNQERRQMSLFAELKEIFENTPSVVSPNLGSTPAESLHSPALQCSIANEDEQKSNVVSSQKNAEVLLGKEQIIIEKSVPVEMSAEERFQILCQEILEEMRTLHTSRQMAFEQIVSTKQISSSLPTELVRSSKQSTQDAHKANSKDMRKTMVDETTKPHDDHIDKKRELMKEQWAPYQHQPDSPSAGTMPQVDLTVSSNPAALFKSIDDLEKDLDVQQERCTISLM